MRCPRDVERLLLFLEIQKTIPVCMVLHTPRAVHTLTKDPKLLLLQTWGNFTAAVNIEAESSTSSLFVKGMLQHNRPPQKRLRNLVDPGGYENFCNCELINN
jgi:hypothetical protein